MRSIVDLIAKVLLPPGSFLLITMIIFTFFSNRRRQHFGHKKQKKIFSYVVVILLILAYLLSAYPGEWVLTSPLENSFTPVAVEELELGAESVIVVLGGGMKEGVQSGFEIGDRTLQRLQAAWRLHQETGADLLLSGGSFMDDSELSEAEVMEDILLSWGANAEQIINEGQSSNTWENAEETALILEEKDYEQLVLVTSAIHMRRSNYSFINHWGEEIIQFPADYSFSYSSRLIRMIPNQESLDNSLRAIHEWVGLIWYSLRALR